MARNDIVGALGAGILAGFVGTAAITVSQLIEMRLRKRKASGTSAKAVEKIFELTPNNQKAETRLGNVGHWVYGTSWGVFRGLLGALGVSGVPATLLHQTMLQGTEMAVLPTLGVMTPVSEWSYPEIALDVFHHSVYAFAAGLSYDWLMRDKGTEPRAWLNFQPTLRPDFHPHSTFNPTFNPSFKPTFKPTIRARAVFKPRALVVTPISRRVIALTLAGALATVARRTGATPRFNVAFLREGGEKVMQAGDRTAKRVKKAFS